MKQRLTFFFSLILSVITSDRSDASELSTDPEISLQEKKLWHQKLQDQALNEWKSAESFKEMEDLWRSAENNYLRLKTEKAFKDLYQIRKSLESLPPQPSLKDQWIRLSALECMNLYASVKDFSALPKAQLSNYSPFIDNETFRENMAQKVLRELQNKDFSKLELTEEDLPSYDRAFLWGDEITAPIRLIEGRYHLELLFGTELYHYELIAQAPDEFELKQQKVHSILSKERLRSSRPDSLTSQNLLVSWQDPSGQSQKVRLKAEAPLQQKTPPTGVTKQNQPQFETNPEAFFEELERNQETTENEKQASIISSPLFWLVVGVAVTSGGYYIYEHNRRPVRVQTP